jgi:autophagy-related protein 18
MPASIYCMSFNATSSLLCVSSATETVHIFKLGGPSQSRRPSMVKETGSPSSGTYDNLPWHKRERSLSPAASDSQPDYSMKSESLESTSAGNRKHNGTLLGMIRRTSQNVGSQLATSVGAYLPSAVAEMWEPARDFAWCKIPKPGPSGVQNVLQMNTQPLRSVVAMSGSSPQVMVVTNEGHFYVFGIDLEKGGDGTLVKTYEVGGESERLGASVIDD